MCNKLPFTVVLAASAGDDGRAGMMRRRVGHRRGGASRLCANIGEGWRVDAGSLGELKWDGASGCHMVIDRKQETFFVRLEQTPSERRRIQRSLKLLVHGTMAN